MQSQAKTEEESTKISCCGVEQKKNQRKSRLKLGTYTPLCATQYHILPVPFAVDTARFFRTWSIPTKTPLCSIPCCGYRNIFPHVKYSKKRHRAQPFFFVLHFISLNAIVPIVTLGQSGFVDTTPRHGGKFGIVLFITRRDIHLLITYCVRVWNIQTAIGTISTAASTFILA